MGVWQGIAQAYKDISAERTREREIREEREYNEKIRKEDFLNKQKLMREENLIEILQRRNAAKEQSENVVGKVKALKEKLGETDDERVAKVLSDPLAASAIFDTVEKVNIKRAENGLEPLTGTEILDSITYYDDDQNVKVMRGPTWGLEDLDRISGDEEEYRRVIIDSAGMGAKRPKPVVSVDPSLYDPKDPKRTEKAAEYFNTMVLQKAAMDLQRFGDDKAEGYAKLRALVDSAQKDPNGAGMAALQIQYGLSIYNDMLRSEDPNVNSISKHPVIQNGMQRVLDIQELKGILNDPNSSEQEKQEAQGLLEEITGIRRGQ